jgi:SAM-dependent methyltransferase
MAHIRSYTNLVPQPVRFGLRRLAFSGLAFPGHGRTCPLCGNRVREFKPHGGGAAVLERRRVVGGMRREADRCPVCHGCDRTRMMMLYLERVAGVGRGEKAVLHVAPDYGLYLWLRRQAGVSYTGTDLDAARYRHIANMRSADLTATPFAADEFDIVICSHVLEHVPDDARAMREIRRILKPGGHALLLTPLATDGRGTDEDPTIGDPLERDRRFGQWDHVRIYGRDDSLARMRAAGFETTAFAPFEAFPQAAEELHLNPLEILPVGTKPPGVNGRINGGINGTAVPS